MPTASSKVKVWRATPTSQTGIVVSDGSAKVVGGPGSFIAVDKEGIALSGPVAFVGASQDRRNAGLWVEMPDMVKMIPTTLVTPMPSQIPFPSFGIIGAMARDVPIFLGLLIALQISPDTRPARKPVTEAERKQIERGTDRIRQIAFGQRSTPRSSGDGVRNRLRPGRSRTRNPRRRG